MKKILAKLGWIISSTILLGSSVSSSIYLTPKHQSQPSTNVKNKKLTTTSHADADQFFTGSGTVSGIICYSIVNNGITIEPNDGDVKTSLSGTDLVLKSSIDVNGNNTSYTVSEIAAYSFQNNTNIKGTLDLSNGGGNVIANNYIFSGCNNITSVKFPNTIMAIGWYTFSDCAKLESFDISNITSTSIFIGEGTFSNCTSLKTFKGNTKLYQLGKNCFYNCTSLDNVDLSMCENLSYIEEDAFYECPLSNFQLSSSNAKYEIYSFSNNAKVLVQKSTLDGDKWSASTCAVGCAAYGDITLSNLSITSLADKAFYHCTKINSVNFPSQLITIGNNAFDGCRLLPEIDLTSCESLSSVGNNAFNGCISLTNVDLSKCTSLTTIGDSAFYGCTNLNSVVLPNTNLSINSFFTLGERAFENDSKLSTINFTNAVQNIGAYCFTSCIGLTSLDFSQCSLLQKIDENAFESCTGLTSIDFSNCSELLSINVDAFHLCNSLASVNFSNCAKLQTLDNQAFNGCLSLTSIDLSQCRSLTKIGENCFSVDEKISQLNNVSLPTSLTSIGNQAFKNCPLSNIEFPGNNTYSLLSLGDGKVITSDSQWTDSSCVVGDLAYGDVTIPSGITAIADNAFTDCVGITSIRFCTELQSIGKNAFSNCPNIAEIDLLNCYSLTTIDDNAFSNDTNLIRLLIPNSVIMLGNQVLNGCGSLQQVTLSWKNQQEIDQCNIDTEWLGDAKTENLIVLVPDGCVDLYQNNATKLGIDGTNITDGIVPTPASNKSLILGLSLGIGLAVILALAISIPIILDKNHKKKIANNDPKLRKKAIKQYRDILSQKFIDTNPTVSQIQKEATRIKKEQKKATKIANQKAQAEKQKQDLIKQYKDILPQKFINSNPTISEIDKEVTRIKKEQYKAAKIANQKAQAEKQKQDLIKQYRDILSKEFINSNPSIPQINEEVRHCKQAKLKQLDIDYHHKLIKLNTNYQSTIKTLLSNNSIDAQSKSQKYLLAKQNYDNECQSLNKWYQDEKAKLKQ